MSPLEKAVYLQKTIDICHSSFNDLNVKAQNISVSPFDDDYLAINYLLLRSGRQRKEMVHVVISLHDKEGNIIQIEESSMFELKKRELPYVGKIFFRLKSSFDKIAKIGVYLQEY